MADPSAPSLIAVHCTSRYPGIGNCSGCDRDIFLSLFLFFIKSIFYTVVKSVSVALIANIRPAPKLKERVAKDNFNFSEIEFSWSTILASAVSLNTCSQITSRCRWNCFLSRLEAFKSLMIDLLRQLQQKGLITWYFVHLCGTFPLIRKYALEETVMRCDVYTSTPSDLF